MLTSGLNFLIIYWRPFPLRCNLGCLFNQIQRQFLVLSVTLNDKWYFDQGPQANEFLFFNVFRKSVDNSGPVQFTSRYISYQHAEHFPRSQTFFSHKYSTHVLCSLTHSDQNRFSWKAFPVNLRWI